MTAPVTADFGPSWLASVPDGATVLGRAIAEDVVVTPGDTHFSARLSGRHSRAHYPMALIARRDRALVRSGARFWDVAERVVLAGGRVETVSAIAFQRPGVETAEAAFTQSRKAGAR